MLIDFAKRVDISDADLMMLMEQKDHWRINARVSIGKCDDRWFVYWDGMEVATRCGAECCQSYIHLSDALGVAMASSNWTRWERRRDDVG